MKVYTLVYQPFRVGGTLYNPVATEVEEYGRILLPGGFAAIVVENPVQKLFHIFLEGCGALIKTGPDKKALVLEAQVDAVNGDPLIMKEQIEQGIKDRDGAPVIPLLEFFSKFQGVSKETKDEAHVKHVAADARGDNARRGGALTRKGEESRGKAAKGRHPGKGRSVASR